MLSSTDLKILTIFLIFSMSLSGFLLPIYLSFISSKTLINEYTNTSNLLKSNQFVILKQFSTGIIIGVAFMHLFVDSVTFLQSYTNYPWAFATVLLAILLLLGIENLTIYLIDKSSSTSSQSIQPIHHDHSHDHNKMNVELSDIKAAHEKEISVLACQHCNDIEDGYQPNTTHFHGLDHHHHLSSGNHSILKALIMEVSIAVHSVIIGFDFGALGSSEYATMRALVIAFVFHQFFEGISLGTAIIEVNNIRISIVLLFALIFALTLPGGVLLGMFTTSNSSSEAFKGFANALAAGSLIYTGLIEMAAEDFSNPELKNNPKLKLSMYIALFSGSFCMALLAYWA